VVFSAVSPRDLPPTALASDDKNFQPLPDSMIKLSLIFYVFLSLVAHTWAIAGDVGESRRQKPNIILIMADDLGYGDLGCYGQEIVRTPNIDQIAAEGIRFTQFYSGSPACAPARCTLMTGKHTGHAATRNNGAPRDVEHLQKEFGWEFPGQNPLPAEEVTLTKILKSHGYATAAIGKWGLGHFGTTGDPTLQGVDLFYGFNDQEHAHNHYPRFLWRNRVKEPLPGNDRTLHGQTYSQDKFTEVALQFVRENQDRPFFLYLPLSIPHVSIQVPEESLAEYEGKIPEEEGDIQYYNYVKHPSPRAGYAAMITHIDRDIGKLMQLVRDLGLDDNTIVLFTSDNGPAYERVGGADSDFFRSSGPLRGRKCSVHEGGIRVPLVARWPGEIAAGQNSDLQAAHWDFLPTFCELVGITPPTDIDGISIAPTLFGQGEQKQHDALYWEYPAYGGQQAIRVGDWKAVRKNIISEGNMQIELYNLADDIAERHNLAEKHPERVADMERRMTEARVPSKLFPLFASERRN